MISLIIKKWKLAQIKFKCGICNKIIILENQMVKSNLIEYLELMYCLYYIH